MKEEKNKSLLLLFLLLIHSINATQIPQDDSFIEFCKNIGGVLSTPLPVNNVVTQGAKCKDAGFGGILVNDLEEAQRVCKHYSPFHMTDAKIDDQGYITCAYEALYVCRTGFKQINGQCYRIENGRKSVPFAKAEQVCTSAGLRLYRHHDERTAGFIGLLFKDVSAIWAKIEEDGVLFDIAHDSGPQYAIVYGIASFYNVGTNSLVKIPNDHNALVVCEYTPSDTIMVLKSKVEMLSKYMYPAVVQGEFSAWRTSNHYLPDSLNIHGTFFQDHQVYCKKSMSALMDSKNVKMFDPKKTSMTKLGGQLDSDVVFLSPFRYCKNAIYHWCSASSAWTDPLVAVDNCWATHKRYFWAGIYKTTPCHACPDGSNWSSGENKAIMMLYKSTGDYEFYGARPRHAPMLCDVMFSGIGAYEPCPSGWVEYIRPDESRACHRYHAQEMYRDEARQFCVDKYKANLAGWHTAAELDIIVSFGTGWFSMKKNSACRYISHTEGDPCYETKTFYDPDDVSNEDGIRAMIAKLGSDQPEGSSEYCVIWNGPQYLVHDWGCDAKKWGFTCTMVTELKIGEIDYNGITSD